MVKCYFEVNIIGLNYSWCWIQLPKLLHLLLLPCVPNCPCTRTNLLAWLSFVHWASINSVQWGMNRYYWHFWQENISLQHISSAGFLFKLSYFTSQVPANTEANKPSLTAEEKKIKAQELRCFYEPFLNHRLVVE